MLNATRTAPPQLSATRCLRSAVRAGFCAPVSKVYPVLVAMTLFAQCLAIGYDESQVNELGPRLDVMGVKQPAVSASHAFVFVPRINCVAPYRQLSREPSAFTLKRSTALPVSGLWAYERLSRAASGAKTSLLVAAVELYSTESTVPRLWWVSSRPASLAAVLRRFCTICVLDVFDVANRTDESDPLLSRRNRLSFDWSHGKLYAISPAVREQ